VMAHVYGHSDFFAQNAWFQKMTRPEAADEVCRIHAREIADLIHDPSIDSDRVEQLMTAGHSLMFHRPSTPDYRRETRDEQKERAIQRFREKNRPGEWDHLKPRDERQLELPDFRQVPLEPDSDLIRFLAEYSPLEDWERRVLEIVAEDSDRVMPQSLTKIINEGWATYWHDRILKSLLDDLPTGFEIEYARSQSGVIHPQALGINPYWLGFNIWKDIYRRYETPNRSDPNECDLPGSQGDEMLFQIRETNIDASFVPGYLSDRLINDLRLFTCVYEGDHLDREFYRITDVPDRRGCEKIRQKLAASVSWNDNPVIEVIDANYYQDRTLVLRHLHDGRDLWLFRPDASLRDLKGLDPDNPARMSTIEQMMLHILSIWQNPIKLLTIYDGCQMEVNCSREGKVDIAQACGNTCNCNA